MASKAYKLTHKHYGSMFKKEDWSLEQEAAYIRVTAHANYMLNTFHSKFENIFTSNSE